jgi:hypothetical protein
MRTHGFRTHILLVVAGAVAVLAGLSRPWYAHAPKPHQGAYTIGEVNGPLYGLFHAMQRWITSADGRTGAHALGTVGQVLVGLTLFCAVAALGCFAPQIQALVSGPLRYAGFAVIGLVGWRVVDPPGPNQVWELRHGALISLAGALVLGVCAATVASAPSRKKVAPARYVPPPPPPAYEGSVGPPQF